MARKKKHEEHADERWLITYADVLTLLFVLFMVMFSMSVVNQGKWDQLKDSLSKSFSGGIFEGASSPIDQGGAAQSAAVSADSMTMQIEANISPAFGVSLVNSTPEAALENKQLEKAKETVDAEIKSAGAEQSVSTSIDERGLTIRLRTEPFLFASGSAQLDPRAVTLLDPVAHAVKGLVNPVVIEGHTDSDPIHTAQFADNFFLGGARACAVRQALNARGVVHAQQCLSRGATRPLVPNTTATNKARNRRVEILVLRMNPVGTTSTP